MNRRFYTGSTSTPDDASNCWHSTPVTSQTMITQGSLRIGSPILGSQSQGNDHGEASLLNDDNNEHSTKRSRMENHSTGSSGFPFLEMVLQNNGFKLAKPRNITTTESMMFRKNIMHWISERLEGDSKAQADAAKFIEDMKSYLTIKDNLIHAMTPTLNKEELYAPSLLHSLLSVQYLQTHILGVVVPALVDVSYTCNDQEDVNFVNQILGQMKWLPELVDGDKFTNDILDILQRATEKAKKEMIRILPDLIPEKYHPKIVGTLLKLLEDFSPLSSTVIETSSVIDISEDDLVKIRASVLETMVLFDAKDFPSFFSFLFKSEDQSTLRDIISSLRDKFKLEIPGTDSESVAISQELVDKIRFCININGQVVPVWTKIVKEELSMGHANFISLDLVMLIIFRDDYKIVEAPLKTLLTSEDITLNLFKEVLSSIPCIVDIIFESISKFLDKLLWSGDGKLYSVITKVLVELFCTVSDYNVQLLVVIFTSVLAQENNKCRDHVLDAFTEMAKRNINKLVKFMPLIMGIMDHVIKFPPSQVRKIMTVMAQAAHVPGSRESTRFESEFSIYIRKQLTSPNTEMKCVGVVGSVATVDHLIQQQAPNENVYTLIRLIWLSVERDVVGCLLFFDELYNLVQSREIPIDVITKWKDELSEQFLSRWTVPEEQYESQLVNGFYESSEVKLLSQMDSNTPFGDDNLVVHFEDRVLSMSPFVIPAHTRLLCALEHQISNGDLSGVDVVTGCPVLIPDFTAFDSETFLQSLSTSKRSVLARYLVTCINFFREVISAFCMTDDNITKIKVWNRLQEICDLQCNFVHVIGNDKEVLKYLPSAYITDVFGDSKVTSSTRGKSKRNKKCTSLTTAESNENDTEVPGPSNRINNTTTTKQDKTSKSKSMELQDIGNDIYPSNVVPFFRRFSRNVFVMLNSPFDVLVQQTNNMSVLALDISSDTVQKVLQTKKVLQPQTLMLLLKDLNYQVDNSHLDIIKDIALDFPVHFFGVLCNHLDALYKTIKKSRLPPDSRSLIESCFHHLYITIAKYLEKVLKGQQYTELFNQALTTMKERATSPESDEDDEKVAIYLAANPDAIHDPTTAVEQLKVMKIIYENVEGDMKSFMSAKIHHNTDLYLQRKWKIPSAVVQSFLKLWLTTSDTPLAVLSSLTTSLISEDADDDIPDTSEYKSCSSLNFHIWYRIIFEQLSLYVSKNTKKLENDVDGIVASWNTAIFMLQILINVGSKLRKPNIILPLLKNARTFLQAFIHHGFKLLLILWTRKEGDAAQMIIDGLQVPTKKIQYICEHCKVEKNTNLMRHVPLVKKVLETFIFRVREVLGSNGAANAFWLGLLKHRNLDGKVIDPKVPVEIEESDDEVEDDAEDTGNNNEDLFAPLLNEHV